MKGLAMDCGTLRRLTYSHAAGVAFGSVGLFLMGNQYVWIYMFAVSLIPASVLLTTLVYAVRCASMSKVLPKEATTVRMKYAIDTLRLLELKDVGKCHECGHTFLGCLPKKCPSCGKKNDTNGKGGPVEGSHSFCMLQRFVLYFYLTAFPAILLLMPTAGIFFQGPDNLGLVSTIITLIIMSAFLFGFWLEYYKCCKKDCPASAVVKTASIVRCPWVSYIELGATEEPKL